MESERGAEESGQVENEEPENTPSERHPTSDNAVPAIHELSNDKDQVVP